MKRDTLIYWVLTAIIALAMGFSGFSYFTNPAMKEGFRHLGFPDYFRMELGAAKILAALVLIIPAVAARFKEWAYVGLGISFISAAIAHFSSGDGAGAVAPPLVFLALLAVSYRYFHKRNGISERSAKGVPVLN